MPEPDALGPLIFPLAQIMFGVMASAPSVYFVPLRLHLITCLHQLAASGKVFIPTAARLAEILEHPDLTVKPTPSTDLAPKIQFLVRLPADSILKVAVR
jgi:nucleolar complex protein 2